VAAAAQDLAQMVFPLSKRMQPCYNSKSRKRGHFKFVSLQIEAKCHRDLDRHARILLTGSWQMVRISAQEMYRVGQRVGNQPAEMVRVLGQSTTSNIRLMLQFVAVVVVLQLLGRRGLVALLHLQMMSINQTQPPCRGEAVPQ
jgi:hypothetical protein